MTMLPDLVWVDVETTGLDADYAQLLEIAVIITGSDLEPYAGYQSVVHWPEILGLNDIVFKMHTDNGLLDECRTGGKLLTEIDQELASLLASRKGVTDRSPLCGSTVGFDRSFVKRDLPIFHSMVHYRSVDVSSVKELVKRWAPDAVWEKRDFHRAMPDIHESIKELRHYRAALGLQEGG